MQMRITLQSYVHHKLNMEAGFPYNNLNILNTTVLMNFIALNTTSRLKTITKTYGAMEYKPQSTKDLSDNGANLWILT